MKIDKSKIKKNAIDGGMVALGVIVAAFASKAVKGKLPSEWLEPLVLFVPGVVGAMTLEDGRAVNAARGVMAVGLLQVADKITSKIDFLAKSVNPHIPKLGQIDTNYNRTLLGDDYTSGASGGSMAELPVSMF